MIKVVKYFSIVVLFSYCVNKDGNDISSMSYELMNFDELPKEVKQIFNELEKYDGSTVNRLDVDTLNLICLDSLSQYELNSIPTKLGPWTDRMELKDLDRNINYKLEYNTPTPLIIYDSNLYISTSYNYLKTNKKELVFKLISLK